MMSEDKPVYVGPYYGLITCNSGDDRVAAVLEISAKLLPSGFGSRRCRSPNQCQEVPSYFLSMRCHTLGFPQNRCQATPSQCITQDRIGWHEQTRVYFCGRRSQNRCQEVRHVPRQRLPGRRPSLLKFHNQIRTFLEASDPVSGYPRESSDSTLGHMHLAAHMLPLPSLELSQIPLRANFAGTRAGAANLHQAT